MSAGEDLDALEDLADEIAVLSAHLHAGEHRLLTLIAQFDRREGWKTGEYRSCAHWLAFRTGIDLGAARQRVRVARGLEGLPEISAAMAQGELSFSKVRALTRIAKAHNESDLLEFARGNTAAQLEKLVRGWRDLNRNDEAERERRRHDSRCFSVFPDEQGMYVVRGRLDPEVGAALMRAVEMAGDALFREEWRRSPLEPETTPVQRRADAVGLLAERAMAAGFGGRGGKNGGKARGVDVDSKEAGSTKPGAEDSGAGESKAGGSAPAAEDAGSREVAEAAGAGDSAGAAEGASLDGAPIPISGSRAERYQIMLFLDPDTLARGKVPGQSNLEDGTRVSAEPSGHVRVREALYR